MTDLRVTTPAHEVEAILWGSDVAQCAPDWQTVSESVRVSLTVDVTLYAPRTAQSGFYDDTARITERYWQQIRQQPMVRKPRTALGRRLLELRAKIVAAGVPLLDWDGVEREGRERRGEIGEDDA